MFRPRTVPWSLCAEARFVACLACLCLPYERTPHSLTPHWGLESGNSTVDCFTRLVQDRRSPMQNVEEDGVRTVGTLWHEVVWWAEILKAKKWEIVGFLSLLVFCCRRKQPTFGKSAAEIFTKQYNGRSKFELSNDYLQMWIHITSYNGRSFKYCWWW